MRRAGDLHPAIGKARCGRSDPPAGVGADGGGGAGEVERGTGGQSLGAPTPLGEQFEAPAGEGGGKRQAPNFDDMDDDIPF